MTTIPFAESLTRLKDQGIARLIERLEPVANCICLALTADTAPVLIQHRSVSKRVLALYPVLNHEQTSPALSGFMVALDGETISARQLGVEAIGQILSLAEDGAFFPVCEIIGPGYFKAFYRCSAPATDKKSSGEVDLMIGLYNQQGATKGEFSIRWEDYKAGPYLCVYDESWLMLARFPQLPLRLAMLKEQAHKQPLTVDAVIELLYQEGFADLSLVLDRSTLKDLADA